MAAGSEKISWKTIGIRYCRGCGRTLVLADVAHFGTTYQTGQPRRFVECRLCFNERHGRGPV